MSKQGDFMIYCTEQYKSAKKLTGKQVSELFNRYRVWDYIYSCFEALHTTGTNYIIEDMSTEEGYSMLSLYYIGVTPGDVSVVAMNEWKQHINIVKVNDE